MRIGELATDRGVNPRTLRFYEQRGSLPPARRTPNGYRQFDARDLDRLRVLIGLRRLDVPLDEATEIAALCAAGECGRVVGALRSAIAGRRSQIARRSSELTSLDAVLVALDQALVSGAAPRPLIQIAGKEGPDV